MCLSLLQDMRSFIQHIQLYPSHAIHMIGHRALGAQQSHPILPPSLHGGKGSSFPGSDPTDEMGDFKSVMDVKPDDSGVVIRYQVDEFTHTWSAGHILA